MGKKLTSVLLAVILCFSCIVANAATASGTFYGWFDVGSSDSTTSGSPTVGERNALRVGEDYLDVMGFSYEGLIDQLKYEGFSHSEAVYACDILFERNNLPVKKGSNNSKVKEIQQLLIDLGFLNGNADGIFGKGTEAAVKSFQTDRGMDVTGIVDEDTYNEMLRNPEAETEKTEYEFLDDMSIDELKALQREIANRLLSDNG